MTVVYLDSSAIAKLAVDEPESAALRKHLGRHKRPWVSSALARTEVLRALARTADPEGAVAAGRNVLARIELVRVNDRVLNEAAIIAPADVRSLDSIHLATARQLQTDLAEMIVYDTRLEKAAAAIGLRVRAPS